MDHVTRPMAAGAAAFRVDCPTRGVHDLIEALFADLVSPGTQDVATIRVADVGGDRFDLRLPDRTISNVSLAEAVTHLVTGVSRLALDQDPHRLHLHGATLSRGGCGVVVSAASGTGKTTLAGALAVRGWGYLSDETAMLSKTTRIVRGFAKPMSFKPGGFEVVPGLAEARIPFGDSDGDWWHVPASRLGAPIVSEAEPTVVVVLQPVPDSDAVGDLAVCTRLHPADTVVLLMSQTMDPSRYGVEAVDVLARLCGAAVCASVQVGPIEQEVEIVAELMDTAVQELEVEVLEHDLDPTIGAGWVPTPEVRAVVLGERVVVHHLGSGAIAALDEAASAVWLAVSGRPTEWWVADALEAPDTIAFLSDLEQLGFVRRDSQDALR